jgi:hypothetical protein
MHSSRYVFSPNLSSKNLSPGRISPNPRSFRSNSPLFTIPRTGSPVSLRVHSPNSRLFLASSPKRLLSNRPKPLSAYEKIRSARSIKSIMLPSFIRVKATEVQKFNSSVFLSKSRVCDSTITSDSRPGVLKNRNFYENTRNQNGLFSEFQENIANSRLPTDEVMLRVGKIQITRAELASFQAEKILADSVIDACFKCASMKNARLIRKGKAKESIYCLDIRFCRALFGNTGALPSRLKKNLLEYE